MPLRLSRTRKRSVRVISSYLHHSSHLNPDNVLQNEKVNIDSKPLHQCILVYTALDAIGELQKSYQADRKVCNNIFYQIYRLNHILRLNQILFFLLCFTYLTFLHWPKKLLVFSLSRARFSALHAISVVRETLKNYGILSTLDCPTLLAKNYRMKPTLKLLSRSRIPFCHSRQLWRFECVPSANNHFSNGFSSHIHTTLLSYIPSSSFYSRNTLLY